MNESWTMDCESNAFANEPNKQILTVCRTLCHQWPTVWYLALSWTNLLISFFIVYSNITNPRWNSSHSQIILCQIPPLHIPAPVATFWPWHGVIQLPFSPQKQQTLSYLSFCHLHTVFSDLVSKTTFIWLQAPKRLGSIVPLNRAIRKLWRRQTSN